jgi:hypothetical protein
VLSRTEQGTDKVALLLYFLDNYKIPESEKIPIRLSNMAQVYYPIFITVLFKIFNII